MRAFGTLVISVVIAIGIGLGVLAAAGSTSTGSDGALALLTSFDRGAGASSEHVSMNLVEHISGYGDETVTMVGDQTKVDGDGEGTFELTLEGKTLDELVTPTGTYIDSGSRLPDGATWMEITASGMSKILGVKDVTSLFSSQGDPDQLLSLLAASSPGGATDLGPATIDGIATTEYKATIDLSSIAQREGAAYGQLLAQYRKFLTGSVFPVTVWIDSSGLPLQVVTNVPEHLTVQGTALSMDVAMTLDLSDFGEHVVVTPPSASQIYVIPDSRLKSIASLAS